jgi:hypothetical protein
MFHDEEEEEEEEGGQEGNKEEKAAECGDVEIEVYFGTEFVFFE